MGFPLQCVQYVRLPVPQSLAAKERYRARRFGTVPSARTAVIKKTRIMGSIYLRSTKMMTRNLLRMSLAILWLGERRPLFVKSFTKLLWSPGIDSTESIPAAYSYSVPSPHSSKSPAQFSGCAIDSLGYFPTFNICVKKRREEWPIKVPCSFEATVILTIQLALCHFTYIVTDF
jgi:hypothetical protein